LSFSKQGIVKFIENWVNMLDIANIPSRRLCRLLGECLEVLDITPVAFAKLAGIPYVTLMAWIYGRNPVTYRNGSRMKTEDTIYKLCKRQRVDIIEVLDAAEKLALAEEEKRARAKEGGEK
jgi:predicted transcriptional regulator